MRVWGLDPDNGGKHEVFWKKIVEATKDCLRQQRGAFLLFSLDPVVLELPDMDPKVGFREICVQQIKPNSMVKDNLEDRNLPHGPPYFRTRGEYLLKDNFWGVEESLLDPLWRFEEFLGDREAIRKHFLEMGESSYKICASLVLRAVLIWTACCEKINCLDCAQPSLQWNKKSYQWRQMICTNQNCGAMYGVKQVKDLQSRVESSDGTLNIDGGSLFGYYHQIRKAFPEKNMYLVMIDASFLEHPIRRNCLKQTYAAEILGASPFMKPISFIPPDHSGRPRIYSKMTVQLKGKWFQVRDPQVGNPVEFIGGLLDDALAKRHKKVLAVQSERTQKESRGEPKETSKEPTLKEMSQEELKDHHRGLRRKIHRISAIKKKNVEELTNEEANLLASENQIKEEADRCRDFIEY